ncbi:MAG: ADP-ribosylglycohydrolase family protein [Candidatus Brockarchaeota archaeon]|nr:ADP-ribosylglycohydrolase family protein [Candidatus Brockarchaeota archaeon]
MAVRTEELGQLLKHEVEQRREEGCPVEGFAKKVEEALGAGDARRLYAIYEELSALRPEPSFPYVEPSDFEGIMRESSGPPRVLGELSESELSDRIRGAWLGRCAGCLLGKPFEGWGKEEIKSKLKASNSYPLEKYELHESISGMVRDDDIDYTILGLHILECKGKGFTTRDVAEEWLGHLPYGLVYTAEKVAYRNLVNGLQAPETATYLNPYREWIGAQIRADMWGYVTPGHPEAGAELAYRDARLSHVKNGIYGEMFVAAALSAALVSEDVESPIRAALSTLPSRSRLAECVRDVLAWKAKYSSWEEAWEETARKYGSYHPVHTINNLAFVLIGLLYGERDLGKTITRSVMCGFDTDCNGATSGSIIGALLGAKRLPSKWVEPLNDRVESAVLGFAENKISDLADRTIDMASSAST